MPGSGPRLLRGLLFGTTVAWGVIFLVLVVLAQRRHGADPMVEVVFTTPSPSSSPPAKGERGRVKGEGAGEGVRLLVEVADTPAERARGLMGRRRLLPGQGMLFVFPRPGRYAFWMKDTRLPLDIIWLSAERRVVHVAEGVAPCPTGPPQADCPTIVPTSPALYAIEAEAGFAKRAGVAVGSPVTLPDIRAAR